jgi:uncharacterized OsmC-like protein
MQLTIINDTQIRLDVDEHEALIINGGTLGALPMLAGSLAQCTAAVLHEYATTAQFVLEPFAIEVRWHVAEQPRRVQHFAVRLMIGPHVPWSRHAALLRAAEHCTVHNTLVRGAMINSTLEVNGAQQA